MGELHFRTTATRGAWSLQRHTINQYAVVVDGSRPIGWPINLQHLGKLVLVSSNYHRHHSRLIRTTVHNKN